MVIKYIYTSVSQSWKVASDRKNSSIMSLLFRPKFRSEISQNLGWDRYGYFHNLSSMESNPGHFHLFTPLFVHHLAQFSLLKCLGNFKVQYSWHSILPRDEFRPSIPSFCKNIHMWRLAEWKLEIWPPPPYNILTFILNVARTERVRLKIDE